MLLRLGLLLALVFGVSSTVMAEEKYTLIVEKQETKAKHRWSIADWLETRDKMRLMDLWLAIHSPSPYEFYIGGLYTSGSLASGPNYQGWNFTASAYAYLFGVEVQYLTTNVQSRLLGIVNFRAFGVYNQATNLTLHAGVKQETRAGVGYFNPVFGAAISLYFAKAFGANFLYRFTMGRIGGTASSADRFEAGAFIDFNFVRVFADYVSEAETSNPAFSFSGFQLGTRLYF